MAKGEFSLVFENCVFWKRKFFDCYSLGSMWKTKKEKKNHFIGPKKDICKFYQMQ